MTTSRSSRSGWRRANASTTDEPHEWPTTCARATPFCVEHVGEHVGERIGRVVAFAPIRFAEAGQIDGEDAQVRGERIHHRRVRRGRRAVAVDQQHRLARAGRILVDDAQLAARADDDALLGRQRIGGAGLEVHAAAGHSDSGMMHAHHAMMQSHHNARVGRERISVRDTFMDWRAAGTRPPG